MPRAGLTPDRVVGVAARLADDVGYDRLTLKEVARRCKVRLPSLYKHVAGLDGLRRGIALLAIEELTGVLRKAAVGRAGRDALLALANAYRAYARAHPGRYAATLRAPEPGDEAVQDASDAVLEVVFAVLRGYDLEGSDAIDATRALRSALHGFVALETAGGFGLPEDVDRSFRRLVEGLDAAFRTWRDAG